MKSSKRQQIETLGHVARLVLVTALLFPPHLWAATITVTGTCTLGDAITAANTDAATGGCPAGSGNDTVDLTGDVTLTAALPPIRSTMTINANGFKIERASTAGNFRILTVDSTATLFGRLTLDNATLTNGYSLGGGGGILTTGAGQATLRYSTITGNSAPFGGGVRVSGQGMTLINTTVSNNTARTGGGGGIYANSDFTMTNSTVSGNTAPDGGGIFMYLLSATITNSTVSGNYASRDGGGFFVKTYFVGEYNDLTLTNTTLSGNYAGGNGGAIFDFDYYGYGNNTITLTNTTIAENDAGGGAAIYRKAAPLTITNSVLANPGTNCQGSITNGGNNFADDTSCGAGFATLTGFDPVLADNGGPTLTHALFSGSSAIDAAGACGLATDQRGVPRDDGFCDSGAFEFAVLAPSLSCVGFDPPLHQSPVTVNGKMRALPLKAELLDEDSNPVTDFDLIAPPVVQVLFDSGGGGGAVDVSDDALPVGLGDEGNQFVFADSRWRFNLKTSNFTASGTYLILMVSGDDTEYVVDPTCQVEFVIP